MHDDGYGRGMATNAPILLCTDGSEASIQALAAGLALVGGEATYQIVTVVEPPNPMIVTGGGHAGGVMTAGEYEELQDQILAAAREVIAETRTALSIGEVEGVVLEGAPGPAICEHAEHLGARAVVIGSRGRGGLRRAVLGSVSDHVVRKAPCPVIVTN
jgi:nucleotide-binding universal stress UspA family protein